MYPLDELMDTHIVASAYIETNHGCGETLPFVAKKNGYSTRRVVSGSYYLRALYTFQM